MGSSYFTKISKVVSFFRLTPDTGVLFCTCNDQRTIEEINTQIIQRAKDANLSLEEIFLDSTGSEDFIATVRQAVETSPDGLIINNLDTQIKNTEGKILQDINFSREILSDLALPILFWVSETNLAAFANKATDLYVRRDRNVIRFKAGNHISQFQTSIPRESITKENFETLANKQLKIELLEKQLQEAQSKKYKRARIAKEIVFHLLKVYLDTNNVGKLSLLYEDYGKYFEKSNRSDYTALCGNVYLRIRQFFKAKEWYLKSLEIEEKQGNEHDAASTYHQLGRIAQEQRDFKTAEKWYLQSLAIKEKQGNEHGAASTYHQLGIIAQEQRDFKTAEKWYLQSLAIKEKQGNEHGAASTYHQLGIIAEEQRDFKTAEKWYLQSLAIKEKQGNEHGAASTYHQLGIIAQEQRDFKTAEKWYLQSLAIEEKQGNEHGAAITYHQLGISAQEQRDFKTAEKWYLQSLAIKEEQGNKHGAAITYHQLGVLTGKLSQYADAGQWLLKAVGNFSSSGDQYNTVWVMKDFLGNLQAADATTQAILRQHWQEAGMDKISTLDQLEQQLNDNTWTDT